MLRLLTKVATWAGAAGRGRKRIRFNQSRNASQCMAAMTLRVIAPMLTSALSNAASLNGRRLAVSTAVMVGVDPALARMATDM